MSLPPDCSLKVKDVLKEFDADGTLARHRHGEVRGQRAADSPSGTLLRNSIKHITELNHRPQKGISGGNEHFNRCVMAGFNCSLLINSIRTH